MTTKGEYKLLRKMEKNTSKGRKTNGINENCKEEIPFGIKGPLKEVDTAIANGKNNKGLSNNEIE